jgi:hypothetical protein
MVTDLDIYRVAKLLIDQRGADARWVAAIRSDELLEQGDIEGQKTWIRILKAVRAMTESKSDEAIN